MLGLSPGAGNPISLLSTTASRTWTPSLPVGHPNYYTPQCNLNNTAANGDCGALTNALFGQLRPSSAVDPETINGWGNRPWNSEFSASIQQELAPRLAMDFGYFRRWYGNFTIVDNRAVGPTDFTTYSITAPVDSRLQQSGQVIGGLYEVNANKVGAVDNLTTFADNYGKQIEHWNGFDLTINARPGNGIVLQGGISTGRTSTDNCDLRTKLPEITLPPGGVAIPEQNCHTDTNFLTQYKFLGNVPGAEDRCAVRCDVPVGSGSGSSSQLHGDVRADPQWVSAAVGRIPNRKREPGRQGVFGAHQSARFPRGEDSPLWPHEDVVEL